jgi:VCBS repeat-containing protein
VGTRTARRSRRRKQVVWFVVGLFVLGAGLTLTGSAGAAAFGAKAQTDRPFQALGDAVGATYRFTVVNTGTTDPIAAVELLRPTSDWTVTSCPKGPAGWTGSVLSDGCRYVSTAASADDIGPGQTRREAFHVTATSGPGTADITGLWSVNVSRTTGLGAGDVVPAAELNNGQASLRSTLHTWDITDVMVAPGAAAIGGACPPVNHTAPAGSTRTLVVCGRNASTGPLTPAQASSSVAGPFITSPGTFQSASVAPTGGPVVLANWVNAKIGTGRTLRATIGSAATETSGPWSYGRHFLTVNQPPVGFDDGGTGYTTDEATLLITPNVLTNDTDPDVGDQLSVVGLDTTGTVGSVTDNGDGTFDYDPNGQFNGLDPGDTATDTFSYTVSDGNGGTDTATVTVVIDGLANNDSPTATDDAATVGEDDQTPTSIDVLGNDSDPDLDTLTITAVDTTGTTGSVTNNGTDVSYSPNGQFNSLAEGETATDSFTYTIDDGNGHTATATVIVTITGANDGPTALDDSGTGFETTENAAFTSASVLGNDTDPDANDTLAVTGFGTSDTQGTVTDNGDGTFDYDPGTAFDHLAVGETATDVVTYDISDGNGGVASAEVTITVTGQNDAPVAADDTAGYGEDDPGSTILVLGNDTDADTGDTTSVSAIDTTGTVGSVVNNGTNVSYDPNGQFNALQAGQTATDTFTYTVIDSQGATDTASVTVTITGANDAPTANDDTATVAEEDGATAIPVRANDTDPDAGTVLFIFSVTQPTNGGAVTHNGFQASYDPQGAFDSLGVGETATDTFTYTILDGDGGSATATVTVTITGANDPPVADDDNPSIGEDAGATVVDVLADDLDPDNDTLTVTSVGTGSTTGLVTNNGTNVSYDPNGAFNSLRAGQTASDSFTYTISDGHGGTSTATVFVTIVGANDAPTANSETSGVGEDAGATTINVLANDTDPDAGDTKEVTAVGSLSGMSPSGPCSGGACGSVSVTPGVGNNLSYDPNGQFNALRQGQSAIVTISYTMRDGSGATSSSTADVVISGANDGPSAGNDTASVGEDAGSTGVTVLANDTDPDAGDTREVTAVGSLSGSLPGGGTCSGASCGSASFSAGVNNNLSYDPGGQFNSLRQGQTATVSFTYTMKDGSGATSTATVTVTVNGANDAPTANDNTDGTNEDTAKLINVLGNDTDPDAGDTKEVVAVGSLSGTGPAGPCSAGACGSVSFAPGVGNNLTYDPGSAFQYMQVGQNAAVGFTYTMQDSAGATSTANVTIVVSGVNDAPIANNDGAYNGVVGNTKAVLGTSSTGPLVTLTGNVLNQNDTDPDAGDTKSASLVNANGASVTVNSDGSFVYIPQAGTQNTNVTFTYKVTDSQGADSNAGTVTLNVVERVWYVNTTVGVNGTGRSDSPFNVLSSADASDDSGDYVFLYSGGGSYNGGITLSNSVKLHGHPNGLSVTGAASSPIVAAAGVNPTITNTNAGGSGITVANDNDIQRVDVTGANAHGITGTATTNLTVGANTTISSSGGSELRLVNNASGNISVGSTIVNGSGGIGADIQGRTGGAVTLTGNLTSAGGTGFSASSNSGVAISFSGTITTTAGTGVNVSSNSGGTLIISGSVTASGGPGVNLNSNPNTTMSFTGALSLNTGTNNAFTATGGGTVSNSNAVVNTVATSTGTAVNVTNTNIGAADLTFRSISAGSGASGPNNAIILDGTGSAGGLTVTGTGGPGTGGTIAGTNGSGLVANNSVQLSLTSVDFANANDTTDGGGAGACDAGVNTGCNGAIKLTNVHTVDLDKLVISGGVEAGIVGTTVTDFDLSNSTLANNGDSVSEHPIGIFGLFGTAAAGTDSSITNNTVTNGASHNIFIMTSSATNAFPGSPDRLVISGNTISSPGSAGQSDGITVATRLTANFQTLIQSNTFNSTRVCTDAAQVDAGNTSRHDSVISGNSVTTSYTTGTTVVAGCNTAFNVSGAGTSTSTFSVNGNNGMTVGVGTAINLASNGDANLIGSVTNNGSITVPAGLRDGTSNGTNLENNGFAIDSVVDQTGHITVNVSGNSSSGMAGGMRGVARNAGLGELDATISNNSMQSGGAFALFPAYFSSGNGTSGETNRVCLNLNNNNFTTTAAFTEDYWLEQWGASNTFQLQGLLPASGATEAQVEAFVSSRDVGGATVEAFGATSTVYTGATCQSP